MKTMIQISLGLALMAIMAGCVITSVYPYYTAKDVSFDTALVGAWADKDTTNTVKERWEFEKAGEQAYKLSIHDGDTNATEFDAVLFKLQGQRFLDCCPRERADHAIPVHYLIKVDRIDQKLEFRLMDYDWVKKQLAQNPAAIRHMMVARKLGESGEGDLVLTADTAELQKFIIKNLKTEGAFSETTTMLRIK